jgi:hypothetical protein
MIRLWLRVPLISVPPLPRKTTKTCWLYGVTNELPKSISANLCAFIITMLSANGHPNSPPMRPRKSTIFAPMPGGKTTLGTPSDRANAPISRNDFYHDQSIGTDSELWVATSMSIDSMVRRTLDTFSSSVLTRMVSTIRFPVRKLRLSFSLFPLARS